MSNFLKETFRPYTEEERLVLRRHYRRRAVLGVISIAITLVAMLIVLLPMGLNRLAMAGTWVAAEDHADGFHPGDYVMEFKDGAFYHNGDLIGMPQQKSGRNVITIHAPAGQYDKTVTVEGDVLTIEYDLPRSAYVSTGSQYAGAYSGFIDPSSTAWVAGIVARQNADSESRHRVETYVRVSRETGLTDEQLAELY